MQYVPQPVIYTTASVSYKIYITACVKCSITSVIYITTKVMYTAASVAYDMHHNKYGIQDDICHNQYDAHCNDIKPA